MTANIRVAVIGVGHLGRYHAQKYAALPGCDLTAIVDPDPARLEAVGRELGVTGHEELEAVLGRVDAVSIATPTPLHHRVGMACLEAGVHVLIEKPLAVTFAEGEMLVELARSKSLVLQVGYLERFNPAFLACRERIGQPQFIEAVRISPYVGRGTEVDVVLDLMSHDLDLITALVDSPVRDLHAVGISLMTASTDLAHVHMVFENGCVANLTASRISAKAERKMRLFQRNRYFSIDFGTPQAREYSTLAHAGAGATIAEEPLQVEPGDALKTEIEAFLLAIRNGTAPPVSGEDGLKAMAIAGRVMDDISKNILP